MEIRTETRFVSCPDFHLEISESRRPLALCLPGDYADVAAELLREVLRKVPAQQVHHGARAPHTFACHGGSSRVVCEPGGSCNVLIGFPALGHGQACAHGQAEHWRGPGSVPTTAWRPQKAAVWFVHEWSPRKTVIHRGIRSVIRSGFVDSGDQESSGGGWGEFWLGGVISTVALH